MYIILRKKFDDIRELRTDLLTIILCLIIGIFPDMDLLILFFIPNAYLHRSFTHSFVFVLSVAFLGGLVLQPRKTISRPFLLSTLLVTGHLFWDFMTKCSYLPYGTMLFWPFSNRYIPTPPFLAIFQGFDWTSWQGILSINMFKQVGIELLVFVPLLLIAFFLKINYCRENCLNQA